MSTTPEVTAIATRPMNEVAPAEMSIEQIVAQTQKIQQCMKLIMKRDEHYGVIPGTGTADKPGKPTLLKPGAEKLCLLFRLDPEYDVITSQETSERISYMVRCSLFHIPTGNRIASGLGSCNSREDKYLRAAPKKCPSCSKETIFVTKLENEPKYYCWKKKGGCGAKFTEGDVSIEGQGDGIKDPADLANTILKMACKRALVAAVLNGTAASDFFTQDLEDLTEKAADLTPPVKGGADPKAPAAVSTPATTTTASPTSTAPTSQTPTASPTATTGKPPRAPSIKHDGTFASHKQVALLHILREKAGIPKCDGNCAKVTEKWSKRANKSVPTTVRCIYHTQLAAFHDCDDKPITTSKDLSEEQISGLIDRYQAKVDRPDPRTSEQQPDLAAIGFSEHGIIYTAKSADLASQSEWEEFRRALDANGDDKCVEDICDALRVMSVDDLVTKDRVSTALALVMAWNTKAYPAIREKVASR